MKGAGCVAAAVFPPSWLLMVNEPGVPVVLIIAVISLLACLGACRMIMLDGDDEWSFATYAGLFIVALGNLVFSAILLVNPQWMLLPYIGMFYGIVISFGILMFLLTRRVQVATSDRH